jgi:hypothetical protein
MVVITVVAVMTATGTWSAGAAECGILGGLTGCSEPTATTVPSAPPGNEVPPQEPPAQEPSAEPPPGFVLSPEGEPVLPPPSGVPGVPGVAPPTDAQAPPLPGDGEEPPHDAGPFPDDLRRLQNSVRRTPANNTNDLIAALAPLGQYGVSPEEAALVGFGSFLVAGQANYSHDWWFPRFGPGWRLHMGTDIFAAMGTPVRAPMDGKIRITNSNLGGLAAYVVEPDGTFWYLAHLSGIAEGITEGTAVAVGQVVGFVGDSGNARGGSPHVHAEYHPGGGSAVDPKQILDQFLTDAIAAAPALIERYADAIIADNPIPSVPSPSVAGADPDSFEAPRSALLWASAMSPSGGAMALAEAEAARVAESVNWTTFQTRQATTAKQRSEADAVVQHWLNPLVPSSLQAVLSNR